MTTATMTEIVIAVGAEAVVFLLALVLLLIYTVGNSWYTSRIGRALVTLCACIMAIILVGLLRYFLHWPLWTAFISYGLTLLALGTMNVAFWRERRRLRRSPIPVERNKDDESVR